jgi:hypothetical protein
MIDDLVRKLSNGDVLSKPERGAVMYILTEYEKIIKERGTTVTMEMSLDTWKKVQKAVYNNDGTIKP